MRCALIVVASSLTAAVVAQDGGYVGDAAVKQYIARLESSYSLDNGNASFQDIEISYEKSCFNNIGSCSSTLFYTRNTLTEIDTVKITYNAITDYVAINNSPSATQTGKVTKSTAVTDSVTSGWTIGGKVSGTIGAKRQDKALEGRAGPQASLEISASYQDLSTSGKTIVTAVENDILCPPRTRCSISTYTFSATVTGTCIVYPRLACGGDVAACVSNRLDGCEQVQDYKKKYCHYAQTSTGTVVAYQLKPCTVTFPLNKADRSPATLFVFDESKLD